MISLVCALLSPASAADVTTFNAHGYNIGAIDGDPRDGLENPRAGRFEAGKWWAGGLFEYARSPLVLVQPSGAIERDLDGIVALDTTFGVAAHSNVRLEGSLPLYFTSKGVDGGQGIGLGDARVGAMVEMVRPDKDDQGFGLGVSPYLSLPTGTSPFLADKALGGGGSLVAGYAKDQVTVSADVGVEFRHKLELYNLNGSDTLVYGLQLGYLALPDLGFNAEIRLHSPFQGSTVKGAQFPAELHLSGRKRLASGGFFVGGVSLPLSSGAGTAIFRAFVGAGFGKPTHYIIDTDGDGLLDNVDACVTEPETVNGWKDDDGCPDSLAAVAVVVKTGDTVVTDATVTVTPPAGVPVPEGVAFQAMPQTEWSASATEGACLTGTGSVTTVEGANTLNIALKPVIGTTVTFVVVDTAGKPLDATAAWAAGHDPCVTEDTLNLDKGKGDMLVGAGLHHSIVTAPGYKTVLTDVNVVAGEAQVVKVVLAPSKVKITYGQIVILDKVFFETGKDIIKPESDSLLDEVAATIVSHPELLQIEVAGHTDSDGSDAANLDLSQRRAQSVVAYIVGKGVEPERLTAMGYGESKPLVPNSSSANKAKNRRVEFNIVKQLTE